MTQEIVVVVEEASPDIVVVIEEAPPEIDVTVSETGLVGTSGPIGPKGDPGDPGISGDLMLTDHLDDSTPHPVYDDGPSFLLLYQNAKV